MLRIECDTVADLGDGPHIDGHLKGEHNLKLDLLLPTVQTNYMWRMNETNRGMLQCKPNIILLTKMGCNEQARHQHILCGKNGHMVETKTQQNGGGNT